MTLVKFRNGAGIANFPGLDRNLGFPNFLSGSLERLLSDDSVNWMPSANIKERANDFKIDLAAPGMDKKDFQIEVEDNLLVVSGERKEEVKEESERMTRKEFHYGSFKRSFSLPESANTENISASYKDGVLSLTIAKREEAKPAPKKQINID